MAVHIGKMVKQAIKMRGMKISELARRINTSRENMYAIFNRQTLDTGLLQKISMALDVNLFEPYLISSEKNGGKEIVIPFRKKNTTESLESIQQKLQLLQNELSALK